MTADFGSEEKKIDVFSLRSDGDRKVICNPTGNAMACADTGDGEERGENGSLPQVVSNGNAADSSTKENGDGGLGSSPEADSANDVGDVRRTDELSAGEKEDHLVNVGSTTAASEDVEKESNTEIFSGNGDGRHLDVVSLNSEPETVQNPRDLEINGGKVASNCSTCDTEVSVSAVELTNSDRALAEEEYPIPLDVNRDEANNLDITVDKQSVPIPVVSDTQIAVCPEASVLHMGMPEMELTVSMQDVAASEKALVASLVATPVTVADLDMMANEANALVPVMSEAKIEVGSEGVQIPEIGNYKEVTYNGRRVEMTETRHEDRAEESNQLSRDDELHQKQGFVYAEHDSETSGCLNVMTSHEMVEVEQEDAHSDIKVEMCKTYTENKNKVEELEELLRENGQRAEEINQLSRDDELHQKQGFAYAEHDSETSVSLDDMTSHEMIEVEQVDARGDIKVEMCKTCNENKNQVEELEEIHRENDQSDQVNLTGRENGSLLQERQDVCAEDMMGNSSLHDSWYKMGAEFGTDTRDLASMTTVTPLNHQNDSESADKVQEISATMDIGDKAIILSTIDEHHHENKSSDREADKHEGLRSEAGEDESQVLDAATADIDQHLELESSMLKEKQNGDVVSYSDLEPICDVNNKISIIELDQEYYSNPLILVEDITSVTDGQASLSSNVLNDKSKQDCGIVSMEADQQAELALVAEKDDRQGSESAAADNFQNLEIKSSELNAKVNVDTNSVLAIQPIIDQGCEISSIELDHESKLPSDQVNLSFIVEDRQESESADMEVQQQGELEHVSEATGSLELETFGADIDQSLQPESGSSEEKQDTEVASNETDCDTERREKLEAPVELGLSDCQHPHEPSLEPAQENNNEQPESLDHLEEEQENRDMILAIKEQESPSDIKEVQQEHLAIKHVMEERAEMIPIRESGEGKKHMLRYADVISLDNFSANGHDECESNIRLQSVSPNKDFRTVKINNVAMQPASSVNNIYIQFGSITQDELLGRSNEPVVAEKEKFYMVRVPNITHDLSTDVKKSQKDLTERTKIRDSVNQEIQEQRAICTSCRENLRSATEKLKTARGGLQTVQNKLLLVQNVNALKEIDDKIKKMEFRLHHGSMTLKEENQGIKELKLLGQQHERLSSSMGPEKEDLSDELGLFKELDSFKADFARAEEDVKAARMKYEDEENSLNVLKAKQNDANATRQKAYEDFSNLKTRMREKSPHYRMYINDQKNAFDYASSRNIEGLRLHCSQQVDKFMNIWNNDDGFRKKYIESTKKSTSKGFRTVDEAPSFLDEPQTFISEVRKDVSLSSSEASLPAIPRASDTVSESTKQRDPSPALQAVQWSKPANLRKPHKPVAESKGTIITVSSGSDDVKDTGEINSQIKREEEIATKAEFTIKEEVKKEKSAVELKEELRSEQRIKAKEAEERKRKQAERAKAKAEYRAQKEAELKEKKKSSKENKKVLASVDASQSGAEFVSAPTTNNDMPWNSQELEAPVETSSKRHSRPVSSIRQYSRIQPVPLPLRNKGRRKTSTWTWMILTILVVGILFLLGNYIHFPSFSFP